MKKVCKKCKVLKGESEFSKVKYKNKEYLKSYCKPCMVIRERERRENDYYKGKHLDKKRDYRFKRKYGISLEEYHEMVKQRKGKCDICGQVPDKILTVDHDHKTNRVRGLLCHYCNTGLGHFGDSIQGINKALRYLVDYDSLTT